MSWPHHCQWSEARGLGWGVFCRTNNPAGWLQYQKRKWKEAASEKRKKRKVAQSKGKNDRNHQDARPLQSIPQSEKPNYIWAIAWWSFHHQWWDFTRVWGGKRTRNTPTPLKARAECQKSSINILQKLCSWQGVQILNHVFHHYKNKGNGIMLEINLPFSQVALEDFWGSSRVRLQHHTGRSSKSLLQLPQVAPHFMNPRMSTTSWLWVSINILELIWMISHPSFQAQWLNSSPDTLVWFRLVAFANIRLYSIS